MSDLCGFDQLKQEGGPKAKIFTKQILLSQFKEFRINYSTKVGCHAVYLIFIGKKKFVFVWFDLLTNLTRLAKNKICETMVLLSFGFCGIDGRMLSHKSSIVLPRTVR